MLDSRPTCSSLATLPIVKNDAKGLLYTGNVLWAWQLGTGQGTGGMMRAEQAVTGNLRYVR